MKGCEKVKALKSNMDRFIGIKNSTDFINQYTLKSNMDRFIDGRQAVSPIFYNL